MAVAAQRHDWDLTLAVKNTWVKPAVKNHFDAIERQLELIETPPRRKFSLSLSAISAAIAPERKG